MRRGVALRLEDERGLVGWGEASPLPMYSPDTLGDCAGALDAAIARPLPDRAGDIGAAVDSIPASLPAARFALESALLGLAARRAGLRPAALLGEPAGAVERTTLLPADVDRAVASGIRCFKRKVGRPQLWNEELAELTALRRRLPAGARIRVDANAAWDAATAAERIEQLVPLDIEWIEQPTPTADIPQLAGSPIPIALDESLREPVSPEVIAAAGAFVLKPAVLGGAFRCISLAADARRRGIVAVVSHLLDGAIAMSSYIELALAVGGSRAHGLDAHPYVHAMRLDR